MTAAAAKVAEDYARYKLKESLYGGIKKERAMTNET
jgi:acetaldehyde dehydrogenase